MNRDELIGKAADYYLSRTHADIAVTMADFALEMIESQAMQFADNITANKEAYRQGVQAGQRAERERIAEQMRHIFATRIGSESIAFELNRLLNELSQTAPADSGE